MKLKRVLAVVLALVMVFTLLAGCSSSSSSVEAPESTGRQIKDIVNEKTKIGVILIMFGAAAPIAESAADTFMQQYPNLEINFFNGNADPSNMATLVNECVTQDYDAIILEAADPTVLNSAVAEAEKSGVPVITLNNNVDTIHTLFIQSSSYSAGQTAAAGLISGMGEKGNVLIYDVPSEMAVAADFGAGFEDYAANYADVKILEHQYASVDAYSQEGAFTVISDMLTKHDDVDAIYCPEDQLAVGAIQAINAAGREDEGILVWGMDALPCGIEAIREGTMYGSSFADRYSIYFSMFLSALNIIQAGVNGTLDGYDKTPSVATAFTPVTKENVDTIEPIARWAD